MSKITVPKIKVPRHHSPRNAFDLSARHNFTAPLGALLPIWCTDLMPNDHIKVNVTDFMRTMPMNSAAFIDAKGSYEFFFVPYSQLWHPFDQFITSMNDYRSTLTANIYSPRSCPDSLPTISLKQLVSLLVPSTTPDIPIASVNAEFSKLFDEFGYSYSSGANRLADFLGYGCWTNSSNTKAIASFGQVATNLNLNIFRFLAYQKIYQDIYRNTNYEEYSVSSFNIDNLKSVIGNSNLNYDWFRLRYRNYGLDYLTNVRPSALLKPAFDNTVPDNSVFQDLIPENYPFAKSGNAVSYLYDHGVIIENGGKDANTQSSISLSSLRAAFAFEKLLDFMNRAPKTYADQMAAIYGVNVSQGRDGKVIYAGGFDSQFQIGDVTQTAPEDTSDTSSSVYQNALGAATGKMTGGNSGSIEFDAKEFGVLMCIYSVIPTSNYDSTRIDPFVQKTIRSDYYIPMYDHLGLQPLYASSVDYATFGTSGAGSSSATTALGWQPRYSEYKCALDLNHGQFNKTEPLSYWTSCRSRGLENWLKPNDNDYGVSYSTFKINPNLLDSIFARDYNGTQSTDPFFGSAFFNVVKVSDMDTDSLPKL